MMNNRAICIPAGGGYICWLWSFYPAFANCEAANFNFLPS